MLFRREPSALEPMRAVGTAQDAPLAKAGDVIAGFRLVRQLGAGSRAELWLGHAAPDNTAALKLYLPGTLPESIDAEIRALSTAEHAHVVQLRDLSTMAGGLPCLVLERLASGSLAQLLAGRGELSVGEAVTILAPVIAAVGALHWSGIVHGGLSASAVLFRESGAPVLACFGHAEAIAKGASAVYLSESSSVEAERRALARLCRSVLERVPSAGELTVWLASMERFPDAFEERLVERVFALGEASPVRFSPVRFSPDTLDQPALPSRLLRADPVAEPAAARAPVSAPAPAAWYAPVLARLPRPITTVRRPVWVAAGIAAMVLVLGLALVPDGKDAAPAPTETPLPLAVANGPVTDEDPVAAFEALVTARDGCIRELSVLCLDGVDQAGSAAMDDDAALIRSIENGSGGESFSAASVALVERDGDAALVSYESSTDDKPASALLVKSEAGWRIRTYLEG